eukprot:PhM_4_TR17401/c0_g2_i1/m.82101
MHELDRGLEERLAELRQVGLDLIERRRDDELNPRLDVAHCPNARDGFQVNHTSARHGGGGGDGQVLDLEPYVHQRRHCDDLTGDEAELLVLVQHSVHGLNPERVDRAVEDDPLARGARVPCGFAEQPSEDTVGPLVRRLVVLAVELAHRDGLGVADKRPDLRELFEVVVIARDRHCLLEDAGGGGLAAHRRTDGHETVSQHRHLEQLDALEQELVNGLQLHLCARCLQDLLEHAVVHWRDRDLGEEIADDTVEQRQVLSKEFGGVTVAQGTQEEHVLGVVGVLAFHQTSGADDSVHGTHTEVVVILRGELLRR